MVKKEMDIERVRQLLSRLESDTAKGKIVWKKTELEPNLKEESNRKVQLTSAHDNHHFFTDIGHGGTVHLQYSKGRFFVWVASDDGIAGICNEYYMDPGVVDMIVKLDRLVFKTAGERIHGIVEAYLNDGAKEQQ